MPISITNFKGSNPRLEPHLLAGEQGYVALDCRLENGSISAWNEREFYASVQKGSLVMHWLGCSILTSAKITDIVRTRVGSSRVVMTGFEDYPTTAIITEDGNLTNIYRLGVPQPTSTLEISSVSDLSMLPTRSREARAYAYAYVNRWGELGALSPPIFLAEAADGCTVSITGWTVPDIEWGVTKVNFYRAVSGAGSSMPVIDATNPFDTAWVLVGSTDVYSDVDFIDDIYNKKLTRSFVDLYCEPPLATLQGVIAVPGTNRLAGYSGNRVYLSLNDSYHNWQQYFELDDVVCGITAVPGFVYVVTQGRPYTITLSKDATQDSITQLQETLPALSCGNYKIESLPDGSAIYASLQGLVILRGNGNPDIVTESLFSKEMWLSKIPNSMIIRYSNGYLFCFGHTYSFCIHLNSHGWDNDRFIELSDHDIIDAKVTEGGVLSLLSADGNIYLWDRAITKRTYTWRSKTFISDTPVMLGAYKLRVQHGDVKVTINVDEINVLEDTIYTDCQGLLPMYSYGSNWWVQFTGTANIKTISIGPTLQELS